MAKIIKREKYLEKIRPFYESDYIKVITGIRRCGKSELLRQIKEEIINSLNIDENHIIYLDLEGIVGSKIKTREDLENKIDSLIVDKGKYYIFIDEIQHLKNFEEALASIRVSFNCSIFVTGSNSKLLKGALSDRLTGRAKEFKVMPFTYLETIKYKVANGIKIEEDDFLDFIKHGGMPQRYQEINASGIKKYLIDLFESIIKKDVFDRHKRINKIEFNDVSKYLIATTGKLFSALSIAKYVKNNKTQDEQKKYSETINNYASYLEECYFLIECRPYYFKGKEALNGTKKYYTIDPGIRSSLSNIIEYDDTFALEGIIFNELIYRGYEVRYGKLRNGEIDFIAIKDNKKCLIQVAYLLNNEETLKREYGAFKNVHDNSPKFVMSLDKKDTSQDGITHINIVDFLLGKVDINLS